MRLSCPENSQKVYCSTRTNCPRSPGCLEEYGNGCGPEVVPAVRAQLIKRPGLGKLATPFLRFAVLAIVSIASFTCALRAQSTHASVAGRTPDPSKAVIVDAKVTAISTDTNLPYEGTTNGEGDYYLTKLPPGSYPLEIEKSGFKKLVKPGVILHVQDARKIDSEMALGPASKSVTAEAGTSALESESGAVSTVIDRTFVENMPLNGRSFQTLLMLSPGVVVTATTYKDQGQFSVNGQRAKNSRLLLPMRHLVLGAQR